MKNKDFNGFSFSDTKTAKRMKYIVVYDGDLDLNGCYGFRSKKELVKWLRGPNAHNKSRKTVFTVGLVGVFA